MVRIVSRARGPKVARGGIGGLTIGTKSIAHETGGSLDCPQSGKIDEKLVKIVETGMPPHKHRVR